MEMLKIKPNGQWELVEKQQLPPDQPYKSYRSQHLQGQLQEERGRKGSLHGGPGVKRPQRQMSRERMEAKVPTPLHGQRQETKAGEGVY